ncbi:kinase-like domain-containing protein [Entophlyctis helioformis]|nr:kinase-like domain-containing protein [Entophlyctis helioformis]
MSAASPAVPSSPRLVPQHHHQPQPQLPPPPRDDAARSPSSAISASQRQSCSSSGSLWSRPLLASTFRSRLVHRRWLLHLPPPRPDKALDSQAASASGSALLAAQLHCTSCTGCTGPVAGPLASSTTTASSFLSSLSGHGPGIGASTEYAWPSSVPQGPSFSKPATASSALGSALQSGSRPASGSKQSSTAPAPMDVPVPARSPGFSQPSAPAPVTAVGAAPNGFASAMPSKPSPIQVQRSQNSHLFPSAASDPTVAASAPPPATSMLNSADPSVSGASSNSSSMSTHSLGFLPHGNISSRSIDRTGVHLRKPRSHLRTGSSGGSSSAWSASHVCVRRKSIGPASPATSGSYSSVAPSPAASFLASLAEPASRPEPVHGTYCVGDEIGEYTLVREIGRGAFSSVFEASTSDSKEPNPANVALKIVCKPTDQTDTLSEADRPSLRNRASSFAMFSPGDVAAASYSSSVSYSMTRSPMSMPTTSAHQQQHPDMVVVMAELDRETSVWSRLHHPNILEMTEIIDVDDATIIVCELAKGGDLLSFIQKHGSPGLPEAICQRLFHQLCLAVQYLHSEVGILHRDLKLENVLLDEQLNIKLCDFGLSEELLMPNADSILAIPVNTDVAVHHQQQQEQQQEQQHTQQPQHPQLQHQDSHSAYRQPQDSIIGRPSRASTISTSTLGSLSGITGRGALAPTPIPHQGIRRALSMYNPIRLEIQPSDAQLLEPHFQMNATAGGPSSPSPTNAGSAGRYGMMMPAPAPTGLRRESEPNFAHMGDRSASGTSMHMSLPRHAGGYDGGFGGGGGSHWGGGGFPGMGGRTNAGPWANAPSQPAAGGVAGSLHYCPPEDLRKCTITPAPITHPRYSEPVPKPTLTPLRKAGSDMWALGCILFAMITGRLPFNDSFLPRLQLCIMNGKYDGALVDRMFNISPPTTPSALVSSTAVPPPLSLPRQVLDGLLRVEADERWSIEQLLAHPWVKAGEAPVADMSALFLQSPVSS